jgi:hypothetical protein
MGLIPAYHVPPTAFRDLFTSSQLKENIMSLNSKMTGTIAPVRIALLLSLVLSTATSADPLPGEVLKFQQLPLNNTPIQGAIYNGHDERSVAYANVNAAGNLVNWQGGYMADDFADKLSSPIVHVRWWGSYINGAAPPTPVQQFLISFESDVPAQAGVASHPGTPLLSQIVTLGSLAPGSGTFTETLVNGNVPEHLYKYNAELVVPFPEQKDTVYWLKIVALTNDPTLAWGWHDRDYTLQNLLASPAVLPGESNIGPLGPLNPLAVWHHQDDAVVGGLTVIPNAAGGLTVLQPTFAPQNYIDTIDGPVGIGAYSKDLAFELFTVPEPSGLGALMLSALLLGRRRR